MTAQPVRLRLVPAPQSGLAGDPMLAVAGTWIHFKGLDTVTLILCSTVITFPGKTPGNHTDYTGDFTE